MATYERAQGDAWSPLQRAILERKIGEGRFWRGEHVRATASLHRALDRLGHPYPSPQGPVRPSLLRQAWRQLLHLWFPGRHVRLEANTASAEDEERSHVYHVLSWIDHYDDQERLVLDVLLLLERRGEQRRPAGGGAGPLRDGPDLRPAAGLRAGRALPPAGGGAGRAPATPAGPGPGPDAPGLPPRPPGAVGGGSGAVPSRCRDRAADRGQPALGALRHAHRLADLRAGRRGGGRPAERGDDPPGRGRGRPGAAVLGGGHQGALPAAGGAAGRGRGAAAALPGGVPDHPGHHVLHHLHLFPGAVLLAPGAAGGGPGDAGGGRPGPARLSLAGHGPGPGYLPPGGGLPDGRGRGGGAAAGGVSLASEAGPGGRGAVHRGGPRERAAPLSPARKLRVAARPAGPGAHVLAAQPGRRGGPGGAARPGAGQAGAGAPRRRRRGAGGGGGPVPAPRRRPGGAAGGGGAAAVAPRS